MPETYTLHQDASCNGGLYLSHNFSNITETASFLGIRGKNYTGTLNAQIRQNTPSYLQEEKSTTD